jgi:hypothetical protein
MPWARDGGHQDNFLQEKDGQHMKKHTFVEDIVWQLGQDRENIWIEHD